MNFDFEEIVGKVKNGELTLIGTGSSRRVYDLENGYVVKVAKDIRGILQSGSEHKTYQQRKSEIFAEISAVSEDYKFLVMPKARRIKNIQEVYRFYKVRDHKGLLRLEHVEEDIKLNGLGRGDLRRASSWGMINETPLIIDYGLTRSIFKKYYRPNPFRKKPRPIKL